MALLISTRKCFSLWGERFAADRMLWTAIADSCMPGLDYDGILVWWGSSVSHCAVNHCVVLCAGIFSNRLPMPEDHGIPGSNTRVFQLYKVAASTGTKGADVRLGENQTPVGTLRATRLAGVAVYILRKCRYRA